MWTGKSAWRRRTSNGQDEDFSDVRADEDEVQKRKKKSQVKCGLFWRRHDTADRVLAAGMVTKPIRNVLGHMFAAERHARLHAGGSYLFCCFVILSIITKTNHAGGPAVREKLHEAGLVPAPGHTYLGDFVKDGGFIDV